MRLITLKCPLCNAIIDDITMGALCGQYLYKCPYCRGSSLVTYAHGEKVDEASATGDWEEQFVRGLFKGDYYDIDEAERENNSRH